MSWSPRMCECEECDSVVGHGEGGQQEDQNENNSRRNKQTPMTEAKIMLSFRFLMLIRWMRLLIIGKRSKVERGEKFFPQRLWEGVNRSLRLDWMSCDSRFLSRQKKDREGGKKRTQSTHSLMLSFGNELLSGPPFDSSETLVSSVRYRFVRPLTVRNWRENKEYKKEKTFNFSNNSLLSYWVLLSGKNLCPSSWIHLDSSFLTTWWDE